MKVAGNWTVSWLIIGDLWLRLLEANWIESGEKRSKIGGNWVETTKPTHPPVDLPVDLPVNLLVAVVTYLLVTVAIRTGNRNGSDVTRCFDRRRLLTINIFPPMKSSRQPSIFRHLKDTLLNVYLTST